MSFESSAIAMNHSQATGTARLVLLGIASHDGDGGAWPSVATLARYANVHPRNVQRAIDRLVELREVRRIVQGGGTHQTADHRRPNLYEFTLRCPVTCDGSKNHRDRIAPPLPAFVEQLSTGVAVAPPGGGSARGGVAVAPPELPTNHPTRETELEALDRNARARDGRGACGHKLLPNITTDCEWGCSTAKVTGASS